MLLLSAALTLIPQLAMPVVLSLMVKVLENIVWFPFPLATPINWFKPEIVLL